MQMTRALTLLALMLTAPVALVRADDDLTMSVGDGTTVESTTGTTLFLGTEYNPSKCPLQFSSLKCSSTSCGELNGYDLECVSLGQQDGAEKKMCECSSDDEKVCQSQANPNATSGTVPQFGDCSENECVDSYGFTSTDSTAKICAERLHCVKEVNTSASVPAQICHTCRSCLTQNDAATKSGSSVNRFNCSAICPTEFITLLNESSSSGSTSGSASASATASSSASSKAAGSTTTSAAPQRINITGLVAALAAFAVSMALLQ